MKKELAAGLVIIGSGLGLGLGIQAGIKISDKINSMIDKKLDDKKKGIIDTKEVEDIESESEED